MPIRALLPLFLMVASVSLLFACQPDPTPTPVPTATPTPTPTPTATPTPAPNLYSDSIWVAPDTRYRLSFPARDGNFVSGTLTSISGGSGNDINFWVEDPHGNFITGGGRYHSGGRFSFRSIITGQHKLVFDNTISVFSGKQVEVSLRVDWQ